MMIKKGKLYVTIKDILSLIKHYNNLFDVEDIKFVESDEGLEGSIEVNLGNMGHEEFEDNFDYMFDIENIANWNDFNLHFYRKSVTIFTY